MKLEPFCKQFAIPVFIKAKRNCAVNQVFILKGSELDLAYRPPSLPTSPIITDQPRAN